MDKFHSYMKKRKSNLICSGLFSIIAGLMLALLRGSILNLVITAIGIGFIVSALSFGIKHITWHKIFKIIIGICAIVFGNTYINISMYILGIALIVFAIYSFVFTVAHNKGGRKFRFKFYLFDHTVLLFVTGILILFNPMHSIESLFFVCGILLTTSGVLNLYDSIKYHF